MLKGNAPLSQKIICLGLDGMDPRLTRKYVDEGKMPNTKAMIERGACREDLVMLGGIPTVTPPMWTTLATGSYPATHGITCFFRNSKDGLDHIEYNLDSRYCKAEPLWNVTAEEGLKTLVWHWPGSSWPPTSDHPNLHVVDGTSPGSVGMSAAQVETEFLFGASKDFTEPRVVPRIASDAVAPCVVTDLNLDSNVEVGKKDDLFDMESATNPQGSFKEMVLNWQQGQGGSPNIPLDKVISPLKDVDANKWSDAPKDAKEFTILFSGGFINRPALALRNDEGKFDRIAIYKNKKEKEPLATIRKGELKREIIDESIKDGERFIVNRNIKLLDIDPNGDTLKMWVSAAMDTTLDTVWHPRSLFKEVTENIGFPPPTTMVGQQEKEFITDIMLDNWNHGMEWQADALNYLIDHEGYDIVFSHFHAIDLQSHMITRYMTDQPYQEGHEGPLWGKLTAEDNKKFMEDVYIQADEYIGRFLHYLDKGYTILVFSDHAQLAPKHGYRLMGDIVGINVRIMEELGLTSLKKDENGNDIKEIDWENTYAVAQRANHIYLNIKGRDEHGIIDPEDQYEWEEEIMTRLYGYKDPTTGKRVIGLALRNREAILLGLSGPECGDIIYTMAEGYNFDHGESLSTSLGEADTSVSPIFFAAGPGIIKGMYTDRVIRQIDFAPTVAAIAGVRMPMQCEGAPVYQILES